MELRVLTLADRARVTALFYDVFTNKPWNDDKSVKLPCFLDITVLLTDSIPDNRRKPVDIPPRETVPLCCHGIDSDNGSGHR